MHEKSCVCFASFTLLSGELNEAAELRHIAGIPDIG